MVLLGRIIGAWNAERRAEATCRLLVVALGLARSADVAGFQASLARIPRV